jgi:hypothetical protein
MMCEGIAFAVLEKEKFEPEEFIGLHYGLQAECRGLRAKWRKRVSASLQGGFGRFQGRSDGVRSSITAV